ncbi:hypothetical protein GDO81_022709 [Engystomops pustulosus]|uniref:DNA polymerase Y-family little finger domain-containing protein n=1 Tax=Engystomops pustulosus TaxID=76066 RepID=A0AAV6YMF6_ENGPU|nr:hypothetical protein GDO81_022709 [Engystomops pustulosus]
MLSRGEDDSAVTPSGPPQSLSEEDSFKKCSTVSDVRTRLEDLLRLLLNRLSSDGRSAHTLRLTIRQFTPTNKYFSRESRQCPIPGSVAQIMSSGKRRRRSGHGRCHSCVVIKGVVQPQ